MYILLPFVAGTMLTGCATMFSGTQTEVVFVDMPRDLKVSENGKQLDVQKVLANVKGNADESVTKYLAPGVMLDKKVKKHTLTLEANGKTSNVVVRLGAGSRWIITDIFFGGCVLGLTVDAITMKWRVARNKYIDVPAVLDGTKHRRQGILKRTLRKQAK